VIAFKATNAKAANATMQQFKTDASPIAHCDGPDVVASLAMLQLDQHFFVVRA
jgi:hypothetical protein